MPHLALLGIYALAISSALATTTNLSYPSAYKSNNVVYSNFFGISIELSIIDTLSTCQPISPRPWTNIVRSWRECFDYTPAD